MPRRNPSSKMGMWQPRRLEEHSTRVKSIWQTFQARMSIKTAVPLARPLTPEEMAAMQGELPDSEAEPADEAAALARHWVPLGGDVAAEVEDAVAEAVETVWPSAANAAGTPIRSM
jgi:hypothetical protein